VTQGRPIILLTNDDGVHAEGLAELVAAFDDLGETYVVAPELEQSGVSHAITLNRGLRVRALSERTYAVDGTPTDCVYLALHKLLLRPPDLVVSGVNHGGNLGDDVLYSGTVSGAMEAAHHGVNAIAVSRVGGRGGQFLVAAAFARALASHVLAHGLNRGVVLNVNVPKHAAKDARFQLCSLGKHVWRPAVEERKDPRGRPYYWIGGPWDGHEDVPGTDVHAIHRGIISVTPIRASLTDATALSSLNQLSALAGFVCA
jgi:5'-nucleotidase